MSRKKISLLLLGIGAIVTLLALFASDDFSQNKFLWAALFATDFAYLFKLNED